MNVIKKSLLFIGIAMLSLAVVSCSDDDSPTENNTPSQGQVMAVHTSPNAPGVDVLVDDAVAVTNLEFTKNTGYVGVNAGTRNFKVNVTNTNPAVNIFDADLPIAANFNYTVFAIDSVENIDFILTIDDLTAPASGKAHVRFFHLSPNAPPVDITDTNGNIVFGDYAFSEYSEFEPLDAGTYDLQVRLQGTNTVVLPLNGITLEDGKIYTVYAKGFVGGAGAQELGAEIIVNN
jgi:hypothetical protein